MAASRQVGTEILYKDNDDDWLDARIVDIKDADEYEILLLEQQKTLTIKGSQEMEVFESAKAYLNQSVARQFDEDIFDGKIVDLWRREDGRILFHALLSDDVREDLDMAEVKDAIRLYQKISIHHKRKHKTRSEESSEEASHPATKRPREATASGRAERDNRFESSSEGESSYSAPSDQHGRLDQPFLESFLRNLLEVAKGVNVNPRQALTIPAVVTTAASRTDYSSCAGLSTTDEGLDTLKIVAQAMSLHFHPNQAFDSLDNFDAALAAGTQAASDALSSAIVQQDSDSSTRIDAEQCMRSESEGEQAGTNSPKPNDPDMITGQATTNESPDAQPRRLSRNPFIHSKLVDFDAISDTRWGTITLLSTVSHPEQDRLLGLAHGEGGKQSGATENPLAGLPNTPLPTTLLRGTIQAYSERLIRKHPNADAIQGAFDHSALVALGMALEDQLTSSLLPLAREHVKRCRRIESSSNGWAYVDWTLPPVEAILKLALDPNTDTKQTYLPSAIVPRGSLLKPDQKAQEHAADAWRRTRKQGLYLTRNNMEIFSLFLEAKPTSTNLGNGIQHRNHTQRNATGDGLPSEPTIPESHSSSQEDIPRTTDDFYSEDEESSLEEVSL